MTAERPAPNPPPSHRFATGFKKSAGDVFVFGAFFLAALCLGLSLVMDPSAAFAGAAVFLICGLYFYPYSRIKDVQLGADQSGLYVAGLGHIEWQAVDDLKIVRTPVRQVERAELCAVLNRPVDDALIARDSVPWWRQLMVQNWSVKKGKHVIVRLEHLKATPSLLETSLLPIWERA